MEKQKANGKPLQAGALITWWRSVNLAGYIITLAMG